MIEQDKQRKNEGNQTVNASFDRIWNLYNEGEQYETTIKTEKGEIKLTRCSSGKDSLKMLPWLIGLHFNNPDHNFFEIGLAFEKCIIDKENGITSFELNEYPEEESIHRKRVNFETLFPWLKEDELKHMQENLLSYLADFLEKAAVNSNDVSQQA